MIVEMMNLNIPYLIRFGSIHLKRNQYSSTPSTIQEVNYFRLLCELVKTHFFRETPFFYVLHNQYRQKAMLILICLVYYVV